MVDSFEIDSKSMRKVESGDVIISVIENQSAAAALRYLWNDRILIKVH